MKFVFTLLVALLCISGLRGQNPGRDQSQLSAAYRYSLDVDNFSMFPNPAAEMLRLSLKVNKAANSKVIVINNIGSTVFEQEFMLQQGNNSLMIDLEAQNIGRGVYFLVFQTENQRLTRKLIVK